MSHMRPVQRCEAGCSEGEAAAAGLETIARPAADTTNCVVTSAGLAVLLDARPSQTAASMHESKRLGCLIQPRIAPFHSRRSQQLAWGHCISSQQRRLARFALGSPPHQPFSMHTLSHTHTLSGTASCCLSHESISAQ